MALLTAAIPGGGPAVAAIATGPASAPQPPAEAGGPAMPALGSYHYDLVGHSNLGTFPKLMRLTISAARGGAQLWTLDASNPDGSGVFEELTVAHRTDGVYLSSYHLRAAGDFAGVDLKFSSPNPVPLLPDRTPAGRTWSFDLNSNDGCVNTHTVGTAPSASAGTRHLHLVTTATPSGKSGCMTIKATRTQDLWVPDGNLLPNRIDVDLAGELSGGASAEASYSAKLRKG